jgi:hypothetical protein
MKLKKLWRLALTITIVAIVLFAAGYGIARCYGNWLQHQPLLVIVDSYGNRTEVREPWMNITVKSPARVWSPRYGLAVQKDGWLASSFQLRDIAVELKTQGARYDVLFQPAAYHWVDRDIRHSVGGVTIDLK